MKWILEERNIKDLLDHPRNARILTQDRHDHIEQSLAKFGLIDKPIINRDNTIIGGHQRIRILKTKGIQTVECWIPENLLDQDEIDELNIRLNFNTGQPDWEKLGNEWDADKLIKWGVEIEEKKGQTPKKPSLTIKFEDKEQFVSFAEDIKIDLSDIKETVEYHHGTITIKGIE